MTHSEQHYINEEAALQREMGGIRSDIASMQRDINELRLTAAKVLEQAMRTNGRVTDHDMRLREFSIREEERVHALAQLNEERHHVAEVIDARRAKRDRWLMAITVGTFVTVLGSGLAFLNDLL